MTTAEIALRKAAEVIETWIATYAPEDCDEMTVAIAKARLSEAGTLWYLANANSVVQQGLASLSQPTSR